MLFNSSELTNFLDMVAKHNRIKPGELRIANCSQTTGERLTSSVASRDLERQRGWESIGGGMERTEGGGGCNYISNAFSSAIDFIDNIQRL